MSDKTGIEWTDATWNPIRGCSQGVAHRFSGEGLPYEGLTTNGKWNGKIKVVESHMDDPLKWTRPRRIFVNSMSDLFHDNVTEETIGRVFDVMNKARQHTFQVLTKRPERMYRVVKEMNEYASDVWPLPNVLLGISIENQEAYDKREQYLAQLHRNGWRTFYSAEPLLGKIEMRHGDVSWVIVGGESGTAEDVRAMHPDWARGLRDQCFGARIPFFFKQWGEWLPSYDADQRKICAPEKSAYLPLDPDGDPMAFPSCMMTRVGKKLSGSQLDGQAWKEFP